MTIKDNSKRIDIWEDDVVRRNGAIDRLEALASERPNFAQRITDMLSVYIKELSREHPAWLPPRETSLAGLKEWTRNLRPARSDIGKAAQAIGNVAARLSLSPDWLLINLENVNLQGVRFAGVEWSGAVLSHVHFAGTEIFHGEFVDATLEGAQMQGCILSASSFQHAYLKNADLSGSTLVSTDLQDANLEGAILIGCNLRHAKLNSRSQILTADFTHAGLHSNNVTAVGFTQEQISSMFGDATVELPTGIVSPPHWPDRKLSWEEFEKEYALYKSNPAAYIPPQDRDDAPSEG